MLTLWLPGAQIRLELGYSGRENLRESQHAGLCALSIPRSSFFFYITYLTVALSTYISATESIGWSMGFRVYVCFSVKIFSSLG